MAVMSSADSALNSSTAIFVKDLFEHHLKWQGVSDRRMLSLARLCSCILGMASVVIAASWPNIIGLLLFSYMLWAPAIFLPVCIGVFTTERSASLNRRVFLMMVVSTAGTLIYYVGFPRAAATFNPTLFGVALSAAVWILLWTFRSKAE